MGEDKSLNTHRVPSFWHAVICFFGILAIIVAGVVVYRISIHILLMLSIIWTCLHTYSLGYRFPEIKKMMSDGISNALGAAYVFILIGIVVASFLESGTIAGIVYYGLDLVHPAVLLPMGLILCSFMSRSVLSLLASVPQWEYRFLLLREWSLPGRALGIRCHRFPTPPTWPPFQQGLIFTHISNQCSIQLFPPTSFV